jgi:hypothetical protein
MVRLKPQASLPYTLWKCKVWPAGAWLDGFFNVAAEQTQPTGSIREPVKLEGTKRERPVVFAAGTGPKNYCRTRILARIQGLPKSSSAHLRRSVLTFDLWRRFVKWEMGECNEVGAEKCKKVYRWHRRELFGIFVSPHQLLDSGCLAERASFIYTFLLLIDIF